MKNKLKGLLCLKREWKFLVIMVLLLAVTILITRAIKYASSFSFEIKEARIQFEKGIEKITQELDEGYTELISLQQDAFEVVDDTEILIDDGIDDLETEKILNEYKLGTEAVEDGNLEDSKKNALMFNLLYNINKDLSFDTIRLFSPEFIQRLKHFWKQFIYKLDVEYYQQRDTPKVGNIICVPTSARILLSGLGYNIPIEKILDFFRKDKELIRFARGNFGRWVERYIKEGKLYQITGIFVNGINMFMSKYYPEFPYLLEYNYWNINKIIEYANKYGIMISTYLPKYVIKGKRKGGHMICITKVYRDFNQTVIAFGIHDPFGNPNAKYKGRLGYDGEGVVMDYDTMLNVMKSYYDDHGFGSKNLYRVLYFRDKK